MGTLNWHLPIILRTSQERLQIALNIAVDWVRLNHMVKDSDKSKAIIYIDKTSLRVHTDLR